MGCTSSVSVQETERRIVLFGKAGDGKSSSGNTIFGENVFASKDSASKVQKAEKVVYGRKITAIDTPGYLDTDCDEETIKSEMVRSLIECAPGVDAFIMVLKVGEYTREDNEVVQKFLKAFGEGEVLKHTVILFTSGENLKGQSIEEFVRKSSQLQELVNKCEGRCHVIDNKYWNKRKRGIKSNRVQVKNLLNSIDEVVHERGFYTDQTLEDIEKNIQDEMKIMPEDHAHPEEKREKAKGNVHVKIMASTISLLAGAVIGVVVVTYSIATILNSFLNLKALFTAAGLAEAGGVAASSSTAAATVVGFGAVAGGVYGGISGWNAAEESESVSEALTKAVTNVYETGMSIIGGITKLSN